ncbi:MAG TPA: shikimate dehydrogenase [Cyanobacteria bacterium UBA8530]|nr:shikimate dehydrogenase [Cyanobacteria bacterium UBA8530]
MQIAANTRLYGLFGYPLGHTLSPSMHNAALESCGIDAVYLALSVPPEKLAGAMEGLRAFMGGANVTVPHKVSVIPFLDGLTEVAEAVGAVNTIFWEGDRLLGDNTDAPAFRETLRDVDLVGKKALILGAGGAAKAVVHALRQAGIGKISLAARHPDPKAFPLCDLVFFEKEALAPLLKEVDLVVNATPLGLPKNPESPLSREQLATLRDGALVYDLIYTPTSLLSMARERGILVRDGSGMLARQAALSFRRWTGRDCADFFEKSLASRV